MNYPYVMSLVLNQPLLMEATALTTFISALSSRVGIDELTTIEGTRLDRNEMKAMAGNAMGREQRPYHIDEGVAVIPIVGTIVQKTGAMRPYSGMSGTDGIEASLFMALDDPQVDSILLDVDSPGGAIGGLFNLADLIHEANTIKPITAYAGELAASAAYALASSAGELYLPRTGAVGSIGVIVAHSSHEKALDKAGVKITLIHAGSHKIDGNPYEDLPDSVHDEIQSKIDDTRQLFAETVARNRGMSVRAVLDTEAAMFTGAKAVDVGLADGIKTFNQVLKHMKNKTTATAETTGALAEGVAADENLMIEDDDQVCESIPTITADEALEAVVPLHADAIVVIEACDAAGFSQLAASMITSKLTEEQVSARLVAAESINDLCLAAGVDATEVLATFNEPVALVRNMLALIEEANIDSTHDGAIPDGKKPGMSTAEIWKHRTDESTNRH